MRTSVSGWGVPVAGMGVPATRPAPNSLALQGPSTSASSRPTPKTQLCQPTPLSGPPRAAADNSRQCSTSPPTLTLRPTQTLYSLPVPLLLPAYMHPPTHPPVHPTLPSTHRLCRCSCQRVLLPLQGLQPSVDVGVHKVQDLCVGREEGWGVGGLVSSLARLVRLRERLDTGVDKV